MTDPASVVAIAVIVVALGWVAMYAYPATRPAARLLALPVLALGALAALTLSALHLVRPRPRRDHDGALPPVATDPGAATSYTARVEADRVDAAERAATRELREATERTGDVAPLLERERELRARLGLPPLSD